MALRRFARLGWAVAILLLCAPPLAAAVYIRNYPVTGVHHDEFLFIVPFFDQLDHHALSWSEMLASFNSHQVVVARLVFLLVGLATGYSNLIFLWLNWLLFALIAWIWFLDFKPMYATGTRSALACAFAFAPVAWLVFSMRQIEMFEWNMTFCEALSIAGTVVAFHLLCRGPSSRLRFAGALLSAIVASGSTASALLVWPIGFACIWWARAELGTRRTFRLVAWSLAGAVAWITFFATQQWPLSWDIEKSVARGPWAALEFFLCVTGAPLGWNPRSAEVIGVLLLACYAFVLGGLVRSSRARRQSTIAIPLIVFSVANVFLVTAGRLGFGGAGGLAPRFMCFTLQGIIGLYLGLTALAEPLRVKIMRGGLLAVIAVGAVLATRDAFEAGPAVHARALIDAYHLRNYRDQPDSLLAQLLPATRRNVEARAQIVRDGAALLEQHGWNVFKSAPASPPALSDDPAEVAVDEVNGRRGEDGRFEIDARAEPAVEIRGWALDSQAHTVARRVFLEIDERTFPVLYGLERAGANPKVRFSGFYVSFAARLLAPGQHRGTLLVVGADGRAHRGSRAYGVVLR